MDGWMDGLFDCSMVVVLQPSNNLSIKAFLRFPTFNSLIFSLTID